MVGGLFLVALVGQPTETDEHYVSVNGKRSWLLNKGDVFLKKLRCCVRGGYYIIVWYL